jgi:hypothetical protein
MSSNEWEEGGSLVWIDTYAFRSINTGPCFICGDITQRFDIRFLSFYCGSMACEDRTIALRNGYDGEFDDEDRWTNEGGSLR